MNIKPIFSQFMFLDILNIDTKKIEEYCYQMKSSNEGSKNSNIGGWQSKNLNSTNFEKDHFLNPIQNSIDKFVSQYGFRFKIELTNSWININSKNSFNIHHTHTGSFISGVLYIKCNENSGNITFVNPATPAMESYYQIQGLVVGDQIDCDEIFSTTWWVPPEKNKLILFPSWLQHYVEPNQSDEDRISISFNTGVKL